MALFGSKKEEGTIAPTARDVVRAIAREEAEDVALKEKVSKLETKAMIKEAIDVDNTKEEIAKLRGDLAMATKKIEELQAKSPAPRA
jgi:5'-deoxynucleotidase YfbR-like HD superfamily hydrolase